jgi:Zn-dependent protease
MEINFIFQIIILLVSIMAHEIAHGAAAYYFGDPTAKNQGRLTLNPLKHIDPFGSVILPLVMYFTGTGILFGWAKPVPYNPYNLRNRRLGEFCVAIAGVTTNLVIAISFAILLRFAPTLGLTLSTVYLIGYIIMLNITLVVFNLIPVPPLDGSKLLYTLVPYRYEHNLQVLEKYGFYFLIIIIVFFGGVIGQIVNWLFQLLV